jgi:hypothetical protein
MNVPRLRWPRLRKRTLRGGVDPREAQRRSVEARRARRAQEGVLDASHGPGQGGEFPQGRRDYLLASTDLEPHTNPQASKTTPANETPADRSRARYEAHLNAKPARPPVSVEEAHYAPYASLGSLAIRLESPADGETAADWSIRRQLVMDEIWRRTQWHNGTVEEETFPRLIWPDQFFL